MKKANTWRIHNIALYLCHLGSYVVLWFLEQQQRYRALQGSFCSFAAFILQTIPQKQFMENEISVQQSLM